MNLTSFFIYCIVVTFTPGPSNIVILTSVGQVGPRKTMEYVWGATVAFGLLLAASALLNHVLAEVLPGILQVMQIVGSVYMIYLAYQVYKMGSTETGSKQVTGFLNGLIMQFVNPKVVLFTFTVIPSYVLPYYDSTMSTFLFVIIITIIGFLAYSSWAVFGSIFRTLLNRHQKAVSILMALFLLYSAIMVSGII
ncbi:MULTISPECIES: LysE family translocator [Paenibacillus]|jgi:threonine/homoserine/homoserine lactone efflux protein|uniref:LysE family translocator n=1 Tax=Paenibacillus taichungensis TaxID=484184 RepID=A0A329QS21_9BACL|nr:MULTISPECIES: LysE family transporter [Paenibacillus]OME84337.1 lysine transporter LysE [Paenibacillus pabuli]MDR9747549.1 LysE family transporter [Paenibacillus taichungensis]MEC0108756.1 LysE family transporter [Paenibacillus taichungensis]MEC0196256.1 LysE family transporter [Paenibacillus taichungensis]NUU57735.1 LysE family transporter [Paenibacillus taichungensis]